jgi:ankyrin repeat protein
MLACAGGHKGIVRLLFKAGVAVVHDWVDDERHARREWAAFIDAEAAYVTQLTNIGGIGRMRSYSNPPQVPKDCAPKDAYGFSALMIAAQGGHADCVSMICEEAEKQLDKLTEEHARQRRNSVADTGIFFGWGTSRLPAVFTNAVFKQRLSHIEEDHVRGTSHTST